jgi:oxygen-independent coproporphyrinogen-3 oxidase
MSFDLIYARPEQTLAAWEAELLQALTYAKDHLSLYQLTIEENTAFHTSYRNGKFVLPEEGLAADMYALTQDIMEAHGLPAYEISNHAKPGQESRHNLAYWKSDDYIGIGPGAHGRYRKNLRGYAEESYTTTPRSEGVSVSEGGELHSPPYKKISTENIKSPERWLEKVEASGNGLTAETALSEKELLEEALMMGLRLSSGIEYKDWQRRLGLDMFAALPRAAVDKLQGLSLITADKNHVKTTGKGRLLLNSITKELLAA